MYERKNKVLAVVFLIIVFGMMAGTLVNVKNDSEETNDSKVLVEESAFAEHVFLKEKMITINGAFQRMIQKQHVQDVDEGYSVVKLNNGYLTWVYDYMDTTRHVEETVELYEYLEEKNIDYLSVQMPFKIDKYDSQLPIGISDYTNVMADEYIANVRDNGIKVLDLRDEIRKDELNQYELFFKTDHHWTPEAALWAAGKTAEFLDKNCNFDIDVSVYEQDNFQKEVLESWFLGSQGKRVGLAYAGVDDLSIITPKFQTQFTFEVPHKNINITGEFKDTMFDYSLIEEKDYYNINPYAAYTGGDFPLNIITNHENLDGKNVLLLRDSFSCTYAPFLSLSTRELHIIDMRYYTDDLKEYIENNAIDMVITAYNPSVFFGNIVVWND